MASYEYEIESVELARANGTPYSELQNKVVVITGGNRGVGAGIVDAFAQCGARVVIAARNKQRNLEKLEQLKLAGVQAIATTTDVSVEAEVMQMVAETREAFGPIEILINNAGLDPRAKWNEITEEDWDRTQEVNSKGYYLTTKHIAPQMVERGWGRIINISSSAFWSGHPDALHYVVTKGANIALTRSLAMALKKTGVTVNCVAPGAVETPKEMEIGTEEYCQESLKQIMDAQLTPGRLQAVDVGWLTAFLCTDAARFINGQTIVMDGGRIFI